MGLEVRRFSDPDGFLDHAGGFLVDREAEHTVLFSVVGRLKRGTEEERSAGYLAAVSRAGVVIAAAGRSPPLNLVLSMTEDLTAVDALADDAAQVHERLPGVQGPERVSERFAGQWAARTGCRVDVAMRMRLFDCLEPVAPEGVAGRFRHVTPADRGVLLGWIQAFTEEAVPSERREAAETEEMIDRLLSDSQPRAHVWEDRGEPVSMAAHTDEPMASPRVGAVYTPPELRRRGYAQACVAALTRYLMGLGHQRVLLFTDLANPTSNRVYTRIGYRQVGDFTQYSFE